MLTLSPGDHIRVWRGTYYHHGIFVGERRVVHFTGLRNSKRAASVRYGTLSEFAQGCGVETVDYSASLPPAVVVARAKKQLGQRGYAVISNNCEHFARWCKVGTPRSEQVRRATAATAGTGGTFGATTLCIQAIPVLALANISGSAQTMSALRVAGGAVGGGAVAGVVVLAAAPAALAVTAVHAAYADDPFADDDERTARRAARIGGTVAAVAGGGLSLATLSSTGSFSAAGITSGLKILGGGRMVLGLAAMIGLPAVTVGLASFAIYKLSKGARNGRAQLKA